MNINTILMIICIVLVLIISVVWILLSIRNRKKQSQIPDEVIKQFERAEQLFSESNGTKTPQEILLQLYKEQNRTLSKQMEDIKSEINNPKKHETITEETKRIASLKPLQQNNERPDLKEIKRINDNKLSKLFRK